MTGGALRSPLSSRVGEAGRGETWDSQWRDVYSERVRRPGNERPRVTVDVSSRPSPTRPSGTGSGRPSDERRSRLDQEGLRRRRGGSSRDVRRGTESEGSEARCEVTRWGKFGPGRAPTSAYVEDLPATTTGIRGEQGARETKGDVVADDDLHTTHHVPHARHT